MVEWKSFVAFLEKSAWFTLLVEFCKFFHVRIYLARVRASVSLFTFPSHTTDVITSDYRISIRHRSRNLDRFLYRYGLRFIVYFTYTLASQSHTRVFLPVDINSRYTVVHRTKYFLSLALDLVAQYAARRLVSQFSFFFSFFTCILRVASAFLKQIVIFPTAKWRFTLIS